MSEAYIEPSSTSMLELFCENSYWIKAFNYFRQKESVKKTSVMEKKHL